MSKPLSAEVMKKGLTALDVLLDRPVRLIMGGGGAMILAHGYPLATTDIDAVPVGMSFEELDPLAKTIAKELGLPSDWLNPFFSTFVHTLPEDYGSRLVRVFEGKHLKVDALSADDMLLMKCFAHRAKDVGHAKALLKKGVDLKRVENRIEALRKKGIPGADAAFDFLDDLLEQMG